MSRLVSRILLAILMLPAAGTVCLVVYLLAYSNYFRWDQHVARELSGLASFVFVCIYWILLWRKSVRWTAQRVLGSLIGTGMALFVGITAGLFGEHLDDYRGDSLGVVVGPLVWLISMTLLWRETPTERSDRLRAMNESALVCPNCGYNLTGLQGTRCPECGTLYTLNEIVAGQPARGEVDVAE